MPQVTLRQGHAPEARLSTVQLVLYMPNQGVLLLQRMQLPKSCLYGCRDAI